MMLLMFVVVAAQGQSSTPPDGDEVELRLAKTARISLSEQPASTNSAAAQVFQAWSDSSPHKNGFVTANGIRINYLDWGGSGPTLILIHGLGDNPHLYDDFAPAFTDSFRVIAYARRGEGDSEAKEPYDGVTLAEDLLGLMDTLGIQKAHLAGFSMGGNEITAMAGMHPERVDRIVYLDSAYDWADPVWVAALRAIPSSFYPSDKDMASLDDYRKFIRAVWFPSVSDPTVFEAFMRDYVLVRPLDGSVRFNESEATGQALFNSLINYRRDYSKIHSPALAIYAATMADTTGHQKPNVRADALGWEEKYAASFRKASIERTQRELSNVEIMKVPCSHRDMVFACRDRMVAAIRRFLTASAPTK